MTNTQARQRHQRQNTLLNPQSTSEMHRFKPFQRFVLNAQPLLSPPTLSLATLIAFDAVVQAQDVESAYKALQSLHEYRSHPTIRWPVEKGGVVHTHNVNPGQTSTNNTADVHDERVVSCFTRIAVHHVETWISFSAAINELEQALQRAQKYRDLPRSYAQLLRAADGYAGATLIGAGRAHTLGQLRMVALDPLCAARETSKLIIPSAPVDSETEDVIAKNEAHIARAVALAARAGGSAASPDARESELVEDLVRAFNAGNALNPHAGMSAVRRELAGVELRIADHHAWARVLLLAGYQMLREGDLAMSSIGRYFTGGAARVFRALRSMPLANLDSKTLCDALGTAENEAEPSNKASVRAVAQAVISQLVEQDLIDPLRLPKGSAARYRGGVRAQVVWPHEVARADAWLSESIFRSPADPVLPIVRCAISVGADTGMRIGEVMRIRLKNIAIVNNSVQITVAPTRMDPSLKSKDSRRICHLNSPRAFENLVTFLSQVHGLALPVAQAAEEISSFDHDAFNRTLQGREELLFGDPHRRNELWHETAVRKWISVVLKAATGDSKTTFHDLRHSWVSLGNEADFSQGDQSAQNSYSERANALGHAVNDLMFTTYTHIFGIGMRSAVDQRLVRSGLLRTASVAAWVGRRDAALRKSLSRKAFQVHVEKGQLLLLEQVEIFARAIELPQAHSLASIHLVEATSPLASFKPGSSRIDVLLYSLRNLVDGRIGPQHHIEIAARAGLSPHEWKSIRGAFRYLNRDAKGVSNPPASESEPEAWLVDRHWTELIDNASAQKWTRIARYLESHASQKEVRRAGDYVVKYLGVTRYLEVHSADPDFVSLLAVLKASGTNLSRFALNFVSAPGDMSLKVRHALVKIRSEFGIDIPIRERRPRDGRPNMYLTMSSGPSPHAGHKSAKDGSAHSMKGLVALFLAAQLIAELESEVRHAA